MSYFEFVEQVSPRLYLKCAVKKKKIHICGLFKKKHFYYCNIIVDNNGKKKELIRN